MSDEQNDGLSRRVMMSTLALSGTGIEWAFGDEAAQAAEPSAEALVDRAFVRIREGLVHYRYAGTRKSAGKMLPLYMVHGGPGSSRGLEGVLRILGRKRYVIAPDTLGFGDSVGPELETPDVAYFTDSVLRILDALKIEKIDFYGSHTGAHIGTELALRAPDRVGRLIYDGVTFFTPEERDEYLANYAPAMQPDVYGRQLTWAWHFVRDMALFFPHYNHTAEHRLTRTLPNPQGLHNSVLDVLKALTTYHKAYNAVYRHHLDELLPKLTHQVLCVTNTSDPNMRYLDRAVALIRNSQKVVVEAGEGRDRTAGAIEQFLDA